MRLKTLFWIGAIGIAAVAGSRLLVKKSNHFTFAMITSDRDSEPLFETRPLTAEEQEHCQKAFDQKYAYYGCGGQAYIFFSEDGNYVLKFFKQHHFHKPVWLDYIPFLGAYRDRKYAKRRKRLELDYCSYKMGFEDLLPETGIIYPHLNKTAHLKKTIEAVDKLGIVHNIDLDSTDFLLQKRATLITSDIDQKLAAGDIEGAKKTISEILGLIVTRCKKGFRDRDPNIFTNCGMLAGRAIKIDVGRFTRDKNMAKPMYFKPELYGIARPFRAWLEQNHPELVAHFDETLGHIIAYD